MTIRATGLCLLLALSCAVLADVASGSAEARCDRSYLLSDPDRAIEPGVLVGASAEIPAHCRVRGVIDGTIRFEVTMPVDGWRGRMMFHAVGGSAGRIGDTTSLLDDGFAMASTDAGHEGNAPDANAFFRDRLAVINYGYRAVHLSTVAAKEIIGAFYGEDNRDAYIWGCSNGGRAVLNALLRFPEDYDGAIAGAPATDQMRELLSWSVATARLQRANPLTPESLALLDANSRNRCDLLDGLEDGVIGLPQACTTDMLRLEDLRCEEGRTADCLTAGQIETTDVPARLDPGPDGKVAYVMEFRNGEADLWLEELPASEVDIKVVGRWAALLPAALYVVDEDSPRSVATYRKIGQRNLESGDVVVEISPDFQGSGGNELHNRLAARTRP